MSSIGERVINDLREIDALIENIMSQIMPDEVFKLILLV